MAAAGCAVCGRNTWLKSYMGVPLCFDHLNHPRFELSPVSNPRRVTEGRQLLLEELGPVRRIPEWRMSSSQRT